jgi:neuropeptide Y receptor
MENSTAAPPLNQTGEAPPQMSAYAQAIIIVMYSTISVLAVGGNLIVVYIVVAYQRMRTVTNYFIVNLACSDILMAVMCIPFTFIANLLMHYWPFGAIMCPIVSYVQAVVVFLSAFTLVAISLDRYRAIMYPLKPRMTTNQVAMVIAVIWMFSLAVPLPIAIMSKIVKLPDRYNLSIERDNCREVWPEGPHRQIYTVAVMVLQYFLPLFVLMFTYSSIAVVIWVKKTPGEAENNRDQRMAASKRKVSHNFCDT